MTHRDDLDQLLSAWLDDPYTPPAPRYLTQVLELTRHTRQRPAWASLERWLPMADNALQPTAATPRLRMARLLLIALLVAALAVGAAIVGSRFLKPSAVIPQGGAAVLAFASLVQGSNGQTGGDIYTDRADGTDLRQLTGTGIRSGPVWSPDGTQIAYRDWRPGSESIVVIDAGGRTFHVSMITIDGSEPVVTLGDGTANSWQPVVAPLPPAPSFSAAPTTP